MKASTPPTEEPAPRRWIARVGLVAIVVVLACVWFRVHSWEAYMYAASHEGFLQLADMFSAVHGGQVLPDISRYHPYHPLFHILVKAIWQGASAVAGPLGFTPSALTVAVVVNKASAVAVVCLAWQIFTRLLGDRVSALGAVAGMFFTKAFLFGAFSGDAHILSLALFLGSLFLVLLPLRDSTVERRRVLLAAVLFSLGASVNLAIFFYGLVPLAVLAHARRFQAALLALSVSATLLFSMYVVLPVAWLGLPDVDAYQRLFSIYSYMAHDGAPLPRRVAEFADALGAGLVGGLGSTSHIARLVHGGFIVGGVVALVVMDRTSKGAVPRFWVPFWFFGFAIGELAMNTESSVNGTIYVMLPTFALVGFLLRALPPPGKAIATLALAAVGALNVARVVVPKVFPDEIATPRLATMQDSPPPGAPVAVLLAHMSLFQEIHYLGHERGFRQIRLFLPEISESRAELQAFVDGHKEFCLLSSDPLPAGLRPFLRTRVELSPDVYHFSVNHPESKRMVPKGVFFSCRTNR